MIEHIQITDAFNVIILLIFIKNLLLFISTITITCQIIKKFFYHLFFKSILTILFISLCDKQ